MFDIQAKEKITIRSFDVHLSKSGQYQIKVFVRSGELASQSDSSWNEICTATVESKGYGTATPIPESSCESFDLPRNSFLSVYVTTVEQANLVMTGSTAIGTALINNADLKLRSGVAVTYPNAGSYDNYAFNGAIHYTVAGQCQDNSGTVFVDDTVGDRTCAWLADNLDRYAFTCKFATVSVLCPVVCDVCQ
jgi:hypothetical protein